jgi:hypothetical protein
MVIVRRENGKLIMSVPLCLCGYWEKEVQIWPRARLSSTVLRRHNAVTRMRAVTWLKRLGFWGFSRSLGHQLDGYCWPLFARAASLSLGFSTHDFADTNETLS